MESHIYRVSTTRPSAGLYIGNFLNERATGPDTFAQLTWLPESGFQLTMWCYDSYPIAKFRDSSDPIQYDSCMACFIDVFPRYRYKGYLSVEFNANGACRCSFGPNRRDRSDVSNFNVTAPDVSIARVTRDGGLCWMAKLLISKELIEAVYGFSCKLKPGHKMRANFYTFSENRKSTYCGSWAPILKPNLHLSECFGLLEII